MLDLNLRSYQLTTCMGLVHSIIEYIYFIYYPITLTTEIYLLLYFLVFLLQVI